MKAWIVNEMITAMVMLAIVEMYMTYFACFRFPSPKAPPTRVDVARLIPTWIF